MDLELELTKSRDFFSMNAPLIVEEGKGMLGVVSLATYESVLDTTIS